MATKQQNSYPLRLPEDLRAEIEALAAANERTLHKEIVALLREALQNRDRVALSDIPPGDLLHEIITRYAGQVKIEIGGTAAQDLKDRSRSE